MTTGTIIKIANDRSYHIVPVYTPLWLAYCHDDIDKVRELVANGADTTELRWTDIFHAIALGDTNDLKKAIDSGCDLEHRDKLKRTPLVLSILTGDTDKTAMLIEAGANTGTTGEYGKYLLSCAIIKDNVDVLKLLLNNGFHHEQRCIHDDTPLMIAAKHGAIKCLKALVAMGADISAENDNYDAMTMYWEDPGDEDESVNITAIKYAKNPEIVAALIEAGANFNHLRRTMRAVILGYRAMEDPASLTETRPEFSIKDMEKYKSPLYGKSNPELATNSYWQAMVKCGWSPEQITKTCNIGKPVWTYRRNWRTGSIIPLPDGRYIEIGGEYFEYDGSPNNWTYNDVIVHNGKGNCDIYIYPEEVFPPLCGHTATLVNQHIYIIGEDCANESESDIKSSDHTHLFRLDIATMKIEKIETSGDIPDQVGRHYASYDGKSKIIIQKVDYGNNHKYTLCLESIRWKKLA